MSEASDEYEHSNKGIHLDKHGIDCFPCRCNRKSFHKETKTTTNNEGETIVNKTEDRSSWRVGSGRHATPESNKIFENNKQTGSVAICDTGWGKGKQITPEELEERVEKIETDLVRIDEDVNKIKKNNFNSLD